MIIQGSQRNYGRSVIADEWVREAGILLSKTLAISLPNPQPHP
jgi:hypothetical protein